MIHTVKQNKVKGHPFNVLMVQSVVQHYCVCFKTCASCLEVCSNLQKYHLVKSSWTLLWSTNILQVCIDGKSFINLYPWNMSTNQNWKLRNVKLHNLVYTKHTVPSATVAMSWLFAQDCYIKSVEYSTLHPKEKIYILVCSDCLIKAVRPCCIVNVHVYKDTLTTFTI